MNGQGLDLRPVFSTYCYACHKTQTHLAPVPSRVPTPRQHIPRITRGIGFLGYPTQLWHTAGSLLRQRRRATGGYSVPCIHFP
jgi:hypothetical protein